MAGAAIKMPDENATSQRIEFGHPFRGRLPVGGSYCCCSDAETSALKKIGRRTPRLRGIRRGVRRPLDSRMTSLGREALRGCSEHDLRSESCLRH